MTIHRACLSFLTLSISLFSLAITTSAQPSQKASGQGGTGGKASGGGSGSNQGQGAGQGGGTVFFESQMLAYGAENQLAQSVATRVCSTILDKSTVIIYDQVSFQNLESWQSFSASADLVATSYRTLLTEADITAINNLKNAGPKFSAFIGGASDVVALMGAIAASSTQTSSTFTIQDSSMAVSLAHQLLRGSCNNLSSLKYFPLFGGFIDTANMQAATKKVSDAMDLANRYRNYIETSPTFFKNKDDPKYLAFSEINALYDQLITAFITPSQLSSQAQGSAPVAPVGITSLVQGAALQALLAKENTYILYADIVAAGGTQLVKKNLVTLVATGDWISYSGGLIVNVSLTKSTDSSLQFADTLRYRTKFTRISHPVESPTLERVNAGDNSSSLTGKEKR